jgi:hypothetical protein
MPDSHHLRSSQLAEPAAANAPGHERRRIIRDAPQGEPARAALVRLILGTYQEMPALSLHLHQAARLFGLRETTCRVVLTDLVRNGKLRQSADGQYRAAGRGVV